MTADDARTREDWIELWAGLYDDVDKAEKIDTNAGDSAVSVVLWSYAQLREQVRGGET